MSLGRAFCLIGAAVDAAAVVALLSPTVAARMLGVDDVPATPALLYAMRTGAALMTGWTCLLLWAAADPAPRRAVMLLTVVPVIGGLVAAELLAVNAGFLRLASIAPLLVLQGGLAALGLAAYRRSADGGS